MEFISSLQNSRVKKLLKYQKPGFRKAASNFLVEGYREILQAVKNQWDVDELYLHLPSFTKKNDLQQLEVINASVSFRISTEVFEKLAYREGSDGIIALVSKKSFSLSELVLKDKALVVVLESLEKPGNIGAILRSCDAAGVDAVILANPLSDTFNPNTVRASLGTIFSVPILEVSSETALEWLKDHHFNIVSAVVDASIEYDRVDMTQSTAIVMGSEAQGLSTNWRAKPCVPVSIPMYGKVDSLNVSNACTILLFEARRQRRKHI